MLTKKNSSKQQRRNQALNQLERKFSKLTPNTKPKQQRKKRKRNNNKNKKIAGSGYSNFNNAYAMCRLRPFDSMGRNTGIPDGSNVRRILIDHRLTTTFTFGSTGTINFVIAPAIPSPVWVQCLDTGMTINGTSYNTNLGSQFFIPIVLTEWQNQSIAYNATAEVFNDVSLLYGAGKFRVVTIGWRVMNMGTSLTDSGLISINTSGLTLDEPIPNPATFSLYSSTSGTNTNFGANQVFIRELNSYALNSINLSGFTSSETVNVPLKEGASGLLRHSANDYLYAKLHGNECFITQDSFPLQSILEQTIPVPTSVAGSGVCQGYDEGWDPTLISVRAGAANSSFMLDLVMCVEYVPQINSSVYSLAKQGPPENKALMQKVDNVAKTEPLATPMKTLVDTVSTMAQLGSAVVAAF